MAIWCLTHGYCDTEVTELKLAKLIGLNNSYYPGLSQSSSFIYCSLLLIMGRKEKLFYLKVHKHILFTDIWYWNGVKNNLDNERIPAITASVTTLSD